MVEISEDNFLEQFDRAFQVANSRRRSAVEGFSQSLWVYLRDTSKTPATAPKTKIVQTPRERVLAATNRIHERLQEPGMEELRSRVGPMAIKYWAGQLASGVGSEEPLQPPTSNTFCQCVYIDEERRKLDRRQAESEQDASAIYKTVHVLQNGVRVPYLMHVEDLRNALGLPNFNLTGLGKLD